MKKFLCIALILIGIMTMFAGCTAGPQTTTLQASPESGREVSYIADFYDNHGTPWLSVEGSVFNIEPNKVKEYYYDTEGNWTYKWDLSSIVSVTIDNHRIETCGNTVIFADSALEKQVIDLPAEIDISNGESASITAPGDVNFMDGWRLGFWWDTKKQSGQTPYSKIVVIQSQEGDPICMYAGNRVSWELSADLPKTTEVKIDGKMLYIHRANFAIIDTNLIER